MASSDTGIYLLLVLVVPEDLAYHSIISGHKTSLSPFRIRLK